MCLIKVANAGGLADVRSRSVWCLTGSREETGSLAEEEAEASREPQAPGRLVPLVARVSLSGLPAASLQKVLSGAPLQSALQIQTVYLMPQGCSGAPAVGEIATEEAGFCSLWPAV